MLFQTILNPCKKGLLQKKSSTMRTQKYSIDFDKNVLGRRTDWDMVKCKRK